MLLFCEGGVAHGSLNLLVEFFLGSVEHIGSEGVERSAHNFALGSCVDGNFAILDDKCDFATLFDDDAAESGAVDFPLENDGFAVGLNAVDSVAESPVSQIKGIETLCLFDDCLVCCACNFYDIDACVDIECGNLAV